MNDPLFAKPHALLIIRSKMFATNHATAYSPLDANLVDEWHEATVAASVCQLETDGRLCCGTEGHNNKFLAFYSRNRKIFHRQQAMFTVLVDR